MEVMGTRIMQNSRIFESEKDTSYLHDIAIDKQLNQGLLPSGYVEKKVHQFYFIKFRPCEDQNVKCRIEEVKQLLKKINQEQLSINEELGTKQLKRSHVVSELQYLSYRKDEIRRTLSWIQLTDNRETEALNSAKNAYRRGEINSCSSRQLISHMRHKTNNLATERQLLRKIKETQQSEAVDSFSPVREFSNMYRPMQSQTNNKDRDKKILNEIQQIQWAGKKAIVYAIQNREIRSPLGSRKAIQVQFGLIAIHKKIRHAQQDLKALEKDIDCNMVQISNLQLKQRQVERYIKFELMLEKAQNEANNRYNRYVSVMSNAKELAEKKDVKGLKELSLREVDTFMSEWNRIKELQLNYKKSTLESLNNRELSWDGRMRNLNEEPIVLETQRYLKQCSCIDCRTRGWHCSSCIFNPIEPSRPKE
ncbi:proton pump-interactor BIP131-like [Pistacia vera]|uniref:proton pump-interactor BIP131-like n=1 Tax=Pistacia vera TaxID=55513 RepID=UPI0012631FA6|nr:proton pump-interactor BIP131-like [Pistacia vera]